eukprot:695157-Pleurochrysis_carterae.AAC.1
MERRRGKGSGSGVDGDSLSRKPAHVLRVGLKESDKGLWKRSRSAARGQASRARTRALSLAISRNRRSAHA